MTKHIWYKKPPARHVCWATYRGSVLAERVNTFGIHAEAALLKAQAMQPYKSKRGVTIFVARVGDGGHTYSRPCADCSRKIKNWNASATVYYTNYDNEWERDDNLDTTYKSRLQIEQDLEKKLKIKT